MTTDTGGGRCGGGLQSVFTDEEWSGEKSVNKATCKTDLLRCELALGVDAFSWETGVDYKAILGGMSASL